MELSGLAKVEPFTIAATAEMDALKTCYAFEIMDPLFTSSLLLLNQLSINTQTKETRLKNMKLLATFQPTTTTNSEYHPFHKTATYRRRLHI